MTAPAYNKREERQKPFLPFHSPLFHDSQAAVSRRRSSSFPAPFSAEKGTGREELMGLILDHIQAENAAAQG